MKMIIKSVKDFINFLSFKNVEELTSIEKAVKNELLEVKKREKVLTTMLELIEMEKIKIEIEEETK